MKKQLLFFVLFTLSIFYHKASAQDGVGIGILSPDPSAILHIQPPSNNEGLLIPRLTTNERNTIATPAQGLLIYDTDLNQFCFYNGGWYVLNELIRAAGTTTITYTGNITVTGTVTAANYGLNTTGNGPVPQGGIIMWSGAIASIPVGWILCNGTNGTPDLRDRFIVAAGSSYSPGATGGANSVALSINEMPIHSHVINSNGDHAHTVTGQSGGDNNDNSNTTTLGAGDKGATETGFNFLHTSSINGNHSHTANDTGGGLAHENRPPYYALAFIMKL